MKDPPAGKCKENNNQEKQNNMETILTAGFSDDSNPELLVTENTIRGKQGALPASVTYATESPNAATLTCGSRPSRRR